MTVLPKLATGLDVNVQFTGVSDFEYTPECSIFDLLGIPLYHGWLVDPQVRVRGLRCGAYLTCALREAASCGAEAGVVGMRLAWKRSRI